MKFGKENEKLEFKKTTAEQKEAVNSIAAILNKHGYGDLYFGISSDGTVLGQMISEKTLREISQVISNHLEPKIYPKITEVNIDDKTCIHVEFSGDNAPYLAFGRPYIRVANEDKQMSSAEFEDYILRKNTNKTSWDSALSDKTSSVIKTILLKDYVKRANQAGRISFNYTSKDDVLLRLDMINDGKLRNATAVLFSGVPHLDIQMAVFATDERITFIDMKRDTGSVPYMVEAAEKYIRTNIRWRVVLDGSIKRKEIPEIPMDAVREALVNSFCHRDYTSSQNNEVTIFSNRIEIYNPGVFPEGLTPQDFINGTERSVKRNPLLAEFMYYVKDIESFGTGLKRISDVCAEAGVKVEFQLLKLGFSVVFYRSDSSVSINENVGDNVGDSVGDNVGDSVGDSIDNIINENLIINDTQKQIIAILRNNPKASAAKVASEIGITIRSVERNIKILKDFKVIEREGSAFGGRWVVV
ncbi:MAG: putative DNA binding domain-containing protein [Oscillospiraceae bacterium]|jgi:ATP-dependent DNA helicase RecG|nr:putative DNA binding domain-containing protein [Oscillospiraceae bacterium]